MDNLLDLLKGQLTPDLLQKASSLTGETPTVTGAAMNAIGPILLNALASKGSTKSGAEQILGALTEHKIDDNLLGNVMGMLSGGDSTGTLLKLGSAFLPMILGNKTSGVLDLITSLTGAKSSTATTLLSLAAPMIGSLLAKQVKVGGLDATGLAGMLTSQKGALALAAPKGLDNILGLGDAAADMSSAAHNAVGGVTAAASSAASAATSAARNTVADGMAATRNAANTAKETAEAGTSSMRRWLLPLLIALALGFLVWNFFLRGPGVGVNLKAAACAPIRTVEQTLTAGMPVISKDSKVADVKGWLDKVKPGFDTLVTAARAASLPVDDVVKGFDGLTKAVNDVSGDTLGAAADTVNAGINTFKDAQGKLKTAAGCQ